MTQFSPDVICARLTPGATEVQSVQVTRFAATGLLSVQVVGVNSLVRVGEVVVSELRRRPMTTDEIAELPPEPPEVREDARLYGFVEENHVVVVGTGTASVPVGPGREVEVRLICEAPPDAPESWHEGRLAVHLAGSAAGEVPLHLAVGARHTEPQPSPEGVHIVMEPGDEDQGDVWITQAPSKATLRACLIDAAPPIRSVEIGVSREVHLTFEEAQRLGLLVDMDADELELVREHGYLSVQEVARAAGTAPKVEVGYGDQVWVGVNLAAPEGSGGWRRAVLALVAPEWEPVYVPIDVFVEDIAVTLEEDSFNLSQGGGVDLVVTVSCGLGDGGTVTFGMLAEDSVLSVPQVRMAYEPRKSRSVRVPVSVAGTAPLGPVGYASLVASFHGDVTERYVPLNVHVIPSETEVFLSPSEIAAPIGGSAALTVAVRSGGGRKSVELTPAKLPPGVSVEPGRLDLQPDDTYGAQVLHVGIHPDNARRASKLPLGIEWNSNFGQQRGTTAANLTIVQGPESMTFSQPIVTPAGVPLGGRAEFVVNSDGSGRFKGHMRATGFFSYDFTVRAVLRSRSGLVALIQQKPGSVYGTDTPGPRQFDWDEDASNPVIADLWPDLRAGSIEVSRSSEYAGLTGGLAEFVGDVLEFAVVSSLLLPFGPTGPCLAALAFAGSELGAIAEAPLIGAAGLPGLLVAGGVAFLVGPTMVIPALVGGTLIGEALVEHRKLNEAEKAMAMELFADTLPWDRIVLSNLSGPTGAPITIPSWDGTILVGLGEGYDNEAYVPPGMGMGGQLLMHELAHAWQIAHKSFKLEYFWKAAIDIAVGNASYEYGPADQSWRHFGLEQQASIVDEWWAGTTYRAIGTFPPGTVRPARSREDPYFRYISSNIRMGETL